jgi:hypothetical protein
MSTRVIYPYTIVQLLGVFASGEIAQVSHALYTS